MEHRLFGAELEPALQVQVERQWNAAGKGTAPDTLLGPEGSGAQASTSGRKRPRTFTTDEPPSLR